MRAVPLLLIPFSVPQQHRPLSLTPHTHNANNIFNPITHHRLRSSTTSRFPNRIIAFGLNPSDSKEPPLYLDENGVVNDMEGYLNHLSLEYDSVWDTKPSWCQPWTITLTGVSIIALSWFVLQSVIVTCFVSLLISAWWYIFLYSYPKAYSEMIAERRERVTNGVEDTFGRMKQ